LRYCIDTSGLIDAWVRKYPLQNFPKFWEKLEALIASEDIIAPDEVYYELERKDDDLFKWAKSHKKMFWPIEEDIQKQVIQILKNYKELIKQNRSGADPFVIALAKVQNCIVVSSETPSENPEKKPHIPDVCQATSVDHINVLQMIQREGWVF